MSIFNETKSVLILLSTFNGQKYLPELLESLKRQQNVIVNILVRDDGSSDSTLDILNDYHKKGILDYVKGENIGACKSFFELIKMAPSEFDYYAFCDEDDVWLDDKLDIAVRKLEEIDNPHDAMYYSGQIITDKCLNIQSNHKLATNRSIKANFIFNQTAGCTMVFNRNLLNDLKRYMPPGIDAHDNWSYKVCAMLGGDIIVDPEGRILYRQHENNAVGLNNKIFGKIKRGWDYIFNYNTSRYATEILNGFSSELKVENKNFLQLLCDSRHSWQARFKLLREKGIVFGNVSLRLLFIVKVFWGKM